MSHWAAALLLLSTFNSQLSTLFAQGTAFTYQGQLQSNGSPASGAYAMTFALFNTNASGVASAGPVTNNAVSVTNGLFTVAIDFGPGVFTGATNWLQIGVATNGAGSFTPLSPRQQLTPVPYAIFASTASNLSGTVASANLSGTYGSALALTNAGNSFSGSYAGNGAGVTSVNAAALSGLTSTNFWQLGGNDVSSSQFLGSTNNLPVRIRVNNLRALIITTNPADSANLIGGSPANAIDAGIEGSVIAGGGTTNFEGSASSNHISSPFSSIGGGSGNWIQAGADHSVIGNGWNNTIASNAFQSVIAGGTVNLIDVNSFYSVIGGAYNTISSNSQMCVIAGGLGNTVGTNAYHSVIAGGIANNIADNSDESVIAGGAGNTISNYNAFIGGGSQNRASGAWATVAGGIENTASGEGSFVGGGDVEGFSLTNNMASGTASVIGGGENNLASGYGAFIGGGGAAHGFNSEGNTANGAASAIVGGEANSATGPGAFIGGGGWDGTNYQGNTASGAATVIGGGVNNQATNPYATVPGGANNIAGGQFSFAAGQQAQATNTGAFVWADSQNAAFGSTTTNQFNVRANGGVRLVTSGAGMTVDGQSVFTGSNGSGLTNLNAASLTGTISPAQLPAVVLTNTESGVTLGGTFNGNGGGLTNLNATQLTGTVPLAQLPNTVITNYETGVTWSNVTLNGTLNIPSNTFSGGALILHADALGNFFAGPNAGNPAANSAANNTAMGNGALGNNYGGNNTAIGFQALYNPATASYNTAVGGYALSQMGTTGTSFGGTNNIALGYDAGLNFNANESSNIDIGSAGMAGENNTIRIGTPGIQTGAHIAGVINGNGGGLTNLNASQFSSGVVPLSVLPGFQSSSNYSTVGGGQGNHVNGQWATIGGGDQNTNTDSNGTAATIGGGQNNIITNGYQPVIGGGYGNSASGSYATIGGGIGNNAGGTGAFLGGGGFDGDFYEGNTASGNASVVGGGLNNQATNYYATVPGGANNLAGGLFSFAAGDSAQAVHEGAFVWADSQSGTFSSTANNQFLIRAQGGVGINMNNPNGASLYVQGNRVPPAGDTGWQGSVGWFENTSTATNAAPALRVVCDGGTNLDGALSVSSNGKGLIAEFGNAGGFPCVITNDGTIYCKNTVLSSDRNLKENFTPLDAGTVLARVAALPVTQWNYKDDGANKKHIGPMAQDFQAAFQLNGGDDKHISTVDEGGVALAAIQGLNQKLEQQRRDKDAEIQTLKTQNDSLAERLNQLEATVKQLAATK
jgi:hypothetical protein